MPLFLYSFMVVLLTSCSAEKTRVGVPPPIVSDTTLVVAAERIALYHPLLQGKRVALVVNQTSLVKSVHLVDTLLKLGIDVRVIFAPEHGIRGKAEAGELISDSKDIKTGIPIVSLYGKKKKPLPEDLKDIDVLVFDIQDVGVRFYTYISTLHYVMEACGEQKIPMVVLDRPNPNSYFIDGPVLNMEFKSFVGMHAVPIVYGMTIGEYAKMINGEGWLNGGIRCDLSVIPCKNYTHQTYFELPVKPSPNLPNIKSILLYPSVCLFEGTFLSLGRGTDKPFQVIGHPMLQSDFSFTPEQNEGAKDPPHRGKLCFGVDLSKNTIGSIMENKSIHLGYLLDFYQQMKTQKQPFFLENLFFDKLAGTDQLRKQIMEGNTEAEIRSSWKAGLDAFKKTRIKYLIYP